MPSTLHPVIVHMPLALAVLLPLVMLGLSVALWRKWIPRRAWAAAVALQALLVVSGVAALRTGEADEERVESVVPETAIEAHEHAATRFVIGAGVVLVIALAALFVPAGTAQSTATILATVATVVVAGLAISVGHAGGELVYRHGAASVFANGPGPTAAVLAREDGEHDDDD